MIWRFVDFISLYLARVLTNQVSHRLIIPWFMPSRTKVKPNSIFIFLFFCFFLPNIQAQSFVKIKENNLNATVTAISGDKYGNFYIGDSQGNIAQYDSTGKQKLIYSPPQIAAVSRVEAIQSVRIFVFYKDLQRYTILNRFLQVIESYDVNADLIGFASVVAPASDNTIWVFDNQDFSLKKYNPQTVQITQKIFLNALPETISAEITQITEYQNKLYLTVKNTNVIVLDILGNYLEDIQVTQEIGFEADELYYLEGNNLIIENLYEAEMGKINLPQSQTWKRAWKQGNKYWLLSDKKAELWQQD
jgi:hypothetical protein